MQVLCTSKSVFDIAAGINCAVCVTTNAIVKSNGCAVMGRGVAKDCATLFPDIPKKLGERLNNFGSKVFNLGLYKRDIESGLLVYHILSFPTKFDWKDKSDLALIRQSCLELVELTEMYEYSKVYIPAPGCSNGGLDWETEVRPVIEPILNDNKYIVILRNPE